MGLVRTLAPAGLPVSVNEARTRLRLEDTTPYDEVARLIAVATRQVEHVTGRALMAQRWQLTAPAFAASREAQARALYAQDVNQNPSAAMLRYQTAVPVLLPKPPLISVEQVEYLSPAGAWQTLPPTAYEVDTSGLMGQIRPVFGSVWPATAVHPVAVRISYTAGYGAADAVEPDIIMAILLLAGHYDLNREATTDRSLSEMPFGVQALLAPYIVPVVC